MNEPNASDFIFAQFIAASNEIMQSEKSKEILKSFGFSEKQFKTFLETTMYEQWDKESRLVQMLRCAFDAEVSEQEAKINECQSLFLTLDQFHQKSFIVTILTSDVPETLKSFAWRGACALRFIWATKK